MNHKKVAIIAAMHGDETYGIELYDALCRMRPALEGKVRLFVANQAAYDKKVRFIDTDMNRSFDAGFRNSESDAIKKLITDINEYQPDYIIDVHTTRRPSGNFIITNSLSAAKIEIMRYFNDMPICVLNTELSSGSLVNHYPNAIALEYSLSAINEQATQNFIKSVEILMESAVIAVQGSNIYRVERLIREDEFRTMGIKNFHTYDELTALMCPETEEQMSAKYFGFWCSHKREIL